MPSILYDIGESVATITLNRPDKLNSFNEEMSTEVQKVLDDCGREESIKCVILTGYGRGFCAGQDLSEVVANPDKDLGDIVKHRYNPIIKKIRELEKPVIASVNGVAAGAGANIALACDIVLASDKASFIQSFGQIGLIPDSGGTFFLPRLVGFQRASALMITGDKISAKDAMKMGMIWQVCEAEQLEDKTNELAVKLASMPTRGFALTKRALNASMNNGLNQQLNYEEDLQRQAGNTYDYKEGIVAFYERREPMFRGF